MRPLRHFLGPALAPGYLPLDRRLHSPIVKPDNPAAFSAAPATDLRGACPPLLLFDMPTASLADRIDALLPQTQCTQCGFAGCRPYAEAMACGSAPINRCPPGGAAGIAALAELLDQDVVPLDSSCGSTPDQLYVALIDEAHCIGCTLCIQA